MSKRIGCLPIQSAYPMSSFRRQLQDQRRARFGVRFLLQYHQNRRRILHSAPEAKPHVERNVAHGFRERFRSNPGRSNRSRHPGSVNPWPEKPDRYSGSAPKATAATRRRRLPRNAGRTCRIHRSARTPRNGKFARPGPKPEDSCLRNKRSANFRQAAARQASGQGIDFRNAGGNNFSRLAIAIGKGRGDASGQGRFEFGA